MANGISITDRRDSGFLKARDELAKAKFKGLVVKRKVEKEIITKTKAVVTEYVFVPDGKSWKDPKLTSHVSDKDRKKFAKSSEFKTSGQPSNGEILLGSDK